MSKVVIFTRVTAKAGRRGDLIAAFEGLHDAVASEPGTEVFVMHEARDEPDVLLFYEVFTDDAALAEHQQSDVVAELGPKMADLVADRTVVTYAVPHRAKGISL